MKSIHGKRHNSEFWVIPNTRNHNLSFMKMGILHRENGPAIEWQNGDKRWFINGEYHREDGPATEDINGNINWYSNGYKIEPTNEMMKKYIRLNPDNILKYWEYPLEIQKLAISLKPSVIFDIKYPHPILKELYPKLYVLKDSGLI